ncbi:MAG: hypothetical protein IJY72_00510 [Akkermansia sp.]|nr:hypothetical protein [Akkermansia sp.]
MNHFFPLLTAATALLLSAAQGSAQDITEISRETQNLKSDRFWICTIGDSKAAMTAIRLESITSVSKHTYNIGTQTIREVTIDTTGNNSVRIYCLNTNQQANRYAERAKNARQLLDGKTGGAANYPSKKFPEGTYSHNIEFQVDSVDDLEKIYNSVMKAVISNKGCNFKLK